MFEFEAFEVLKIKESRQYRRDDCFQNKNNDELGHYGRTLISTTGIVLQQSKLLKSHKQILDVSNYPKGIYLISVSNKDNYIFKSYLFFEIVLANYYLNYCFSSYCDNDTFCNKIYITFDQPFSHKHIQAMSPKTKMQFQAIRSEKEELILETALQLFAKNGYLSTPVSLIAKEAGISKGLMYNYFKSKEELLHKIMLDKLNQFMDFLVIDDITNVKKQEIIDFIDGNFSLLVSEQDFFKLYFSLLVQPDVFSLMGDEMMKIFEGVIIAINNYYENKGCKNSYVKTRFLLAIFDGVGIHYVLDPDNFPLDEVKEMIIEQL